MTQRSSHSSGSAGTEAVLEHVVLDVAPDREAEFEAAITRGAPLIAGMPGCRTVRVLRCHERAGRYLLLVEWDTLEAHTVGFRGSESFQQWRELTHHFYDPPPTVEHFTSAVYG